MTKYVIILTLMFSVVTVMAARTDYAEPEGFRSINKIEKKKNVRDGSIHVIGGRRSFNHGK